MMTNIQNYKPCRQRGFSLLELLIYIAVIIVIMLVLTSILIAISRSNTTSNAQTDVSSNIRYAAAEISSDIRAATAVGTPATAGASGASISMTVSGGTVIYCVVSGVLYREATTGTCNATSVPITSPSVTVAAPTFLRLENTNTILSKTIISIQFTLAVSNSSTSPEGLFSLTKRVTTSLR
jgi:Tfp pilus assembly protein PilW